MNINWSKGFRRLSNAVVTFVWIAVLLDQVNEAFTGIWSIGRFGGVIGFTLAFTVAWYALAAGIAWVARGFIEQRN